MHCALRLIGVVVGVAAYTTAWVVVIHHWAITIAP